ncbi:aminotransferase class IV [Clostridium sp. CF011]|uniref:aminotransferase class IV n=1 Tax=unclassified Clostridium TaxID=2614128 RepID=UPI001C0BB3E8|nr:MULTISPECIES: aminotransferase class IV [unclassified Clostridium]MBU3090638.1 aminotransferase class IV [Clostridium sp. CF011]MBW9144368.1 aminotransferase class IV [Clostridium sp. CM027]UVE41003.1 aminotransferase class IV [Clostridium sp. CM027]WAG69990.1 aminotransferase class IV [Clostridium sp. CF011]
MIFVNGELSVDKISLDSGFSFGRGAFETILVKEKPLFLAEHIERLNRGLNTLNVNKKITETEIYAATQKLNCKNCVLKIMVSEKNTIITKREMAYKQSDYDEGFALGLSEVRRNAHSNLTYVKSFNYIENIIERDKIIDKGYNEALFLNTEGFISEGAVSNIFFIKNGIIFTPKIKCGLLPGIVRDFIIRNLLPIGFIVQEGEFTLEELMKAEGVFITNSIMGIMKVNKIEDKVVNESTVVSEIKRYYDRYVENHKE